MIATAGADRLQEGMRRAFGKPTGRAARVHDGQSILIVYVPEDGVETARKALDTASTKFPMRTRITVEEISVDEQAPVLVQAPVPAEEAEPTDAAEEDAPIVTAGAQSERAAPTPSSSG